MRTAVAVLAAWVLSLPAFALEPFVFEMDFERPQYEQAWGTLFEAHSADGRFVCSAGFVSAIQTRYHTNANDLEFWCRDTSKALDLQWRALPKPHPTLTQAYFANYRGTLVEAISYQAWDGSGWVPLADAVPDFSGGTSIFWQRFGDGQYLHTEYGNCGNAFALKAGERKYGALPDAHPTFAYTNGDHLVVMDNDGLGGAGLVERGQCDPITLFPLAAETGRAYGAFNFHGAVIFGGSSTTDNGLLYEIGSAGLGAIAPDADEGRVAGEYYAYTPFKGELLVGLYPSGSVAALSGDLKRLRVTNEFTPLLPGDWSDGEIGHYREAQALLTSYGYVFSGLYPWGEVTSYDAFTGATNRSRLFGHPKREGRLPYIDEAARIYRAHLTSFDESAWAQRIPNIVVFNGELCASTATMSGERYDAAVQTFMTAEQAQDYGMVYCAELPNHLLFSGEIPKKSHLTFVMGEGVMHLLIDRKEVASATLSQDIDQELQLTSDSSAGIYGPLIR